MAVKARTYFKMFAQRTGKTNKQTKNTEKHLGNSVFNYRWFRDIARRLLFPASVLSEVSLGGTLFYTVVLQPEKQNAWAQLD